MSNTEERSLGDVTAEAVSEDATPPVTPESFDFEAFLSGCRPVRRSIRLYPRADLIGDMEHIVSQIDDTPPGEPIDDLVDEYERLLAEFHEAAVTVYVEGRSEEWVDHFRKSRMPEGVSELAGDDPRTIGIILEQLAEQVVTPGLTVPQLERLADTAPHELNKLIATMTFANTQLPQSAQVLTRDFSQRRSAARRG